MKDHSLLKEIISKNQNFLHGCHYLILMSILSICSNCVGAKVFYAESIDKLIKNMRDCNPDIMTAVPRFYQNLYQKINSNFNKAKGLKNI